MSQIEETIAIGNIPAEGESTPDHVSDKQNHPVKTVYRVSMEEPDKAQVVLNVSNGYIRTKLGILNIIQICSSLTCLVALVSSGVLQFGQDRDDKDSWWWRFRLLIFVSVFSSLVSFSALFLHTCGVIEILPLDWALFDLVMYILMALLHLVSDSLALHAAIRLNNPQDDLPTPDWSHNHMIAALVSSFLCVVAFTFSSIILFMGIRRNLDQGRRKNRQVEEKTEDPQRFQLYQQPSNSTVVEAA